ncbi:hypothetical protein [Xylophilus ampelinus]|uniref:Uncharacterized protein n=1 Tax=Xylophilus ampelinus TaxID=54067 RepID=A0A318SI37_9BURK|nr:hypothetical protein [Xylophilus ampelinus]MCS4511339.1 hypothetical protein [Xylophilus ampelinus]PYE74905.1 hypothetical protein DFQ15_12348 [Xylophilus ampelinus]
MPASEPQIFPTDDQVREAKNVDDKDLKPSLRPGTADSGKDKAAADRPGLRQGGGHDTDEGEISIGG